MERRRILRKKPLIEAILEVRWVLERGSSPQLSRDPHYQFLLGKLFENVKTGFPHHEELPAALVPAEMTPHTVHHRFRVAPNGWPLLQVGPGVFTFNETSNYEWENFERQINKAVVALVRSHPKPEALQFETLMLRYINAVPIDPATNLLGFLSEKMGTALELPNAIFQDGNVRSAPDRLATEFVFPCAKPAGALQVKLSTGSKEGQPALIFELWFISKGEHVPRVPQGFSDWAAAAHAVIEESFFHLIAGELEKEFSDNA